MKFFGGGCFLLFISVFYLAGFGMLAGAVRSALQSTQAAKWPTVPGTVSKLELKESSDSEGGCTHQVVVEYAYTVSGQSYHSSRLAFGYNASSNTTAHNEILEKLKGAKTVAVRYNPGKPEESCLSYGIHGSIRTLFTFSVVWLAFVIGFTLLVFMSGQTDDVLLRNLSVG